MLQLFDTLSRKIRPFEARNSREVKLYNCGPTVYNYIHLGNLRAYVFIDLLKKYLRYSGFKVKHVMNITDVDDKTIRGSRVSHKSLREFTDFYLKAFLKDLKLLNIELPDVMPRATEHIQEIVSLIKKLENKGLAYRVGGSVYFKISQFFTYGELAQIKKRALRQNASGRLNLSDEYEKEQVGDFVLWKAWQLEDGDVFWDTELGRGRPGWHIECSAMAMKYLGRTIDIHSGGIDLIFPHHTNEIAQSEGATRKKFVNYWLHNAHLIVNGQKMSKSLGNFYTLRDIQKRGYNPLLLRLILLKTHYRQTLDFTFKSFDEAKAIAKKFIDFLVDLDAIDYGRKHNNIDIKKKILTNRGRFREAMDDDLNISVALAAIFDFMNDINKYIGTFNEQQAEEIKNYVFELDNILGFVKTIYDLYNQKVIKILSNKKIKKMLTDRVVLRQNNDFVAADKIRDELFKKNILISDMPNNKYNIRLLNFL